MRRRSGLLVPLETQVTVPGRPVGAPSYRAELVRTLRVVLVAGLLAGLVIGILLRLAMLVLRLASPGTSGLVSDDGFEIGVVTPFGIYNLLAFGILLGCAGAAGYVAVAPFLVGPRALRRMTVALTAMLLGGTAAIHEDGVDFTALDTEVAVGLFLVVPFLSGLLVSSVVDLVERRLDGWPRWLPVLTLVHPLLVLAVIGIAVVVAALLPVRRALLPRILASPVLTWVVRGCFALVPLAAASGLTRDLQAVLG
ncbi:hypothetical protein [Pimelobacter simplex]|uniref:hypothetical protein n=1 Tax=Nocardioides simplex TaxID=2045 RepID=UPI001932BD05|nr:hypothetical protein [Pimelobacter simplex]